MEEYKAIYKCRLCGQVYSDVVTGQALATIHAVELAAGIVPTMRQAPQKLQAHFCGGQYDGSLGLADFQGWKKEDKA